MRNVIEITKKNGDKKYVVFATRKSMHDWIKKLEYFKKKYEKYGFETEHYIILKEQGEI